MINKKIVISLAAVLVTGLLLSFAILKNTNTVQPNTSLIEKQDPAPVHFVSNDVGGMKWYNMNEALELQKQTGKKLFIDVYTSWCGPCKMLSSGTLANAIIQKGLNDYFIPVKFNAEGRDTVNFNGVTYLNQKPDYKNGARGYTHDFTYVIAQTPQGIGYPTMVFLNEKLEMIQPFQGYLSAEQLEPIISFFGSDAYLNTKWEDFMKGFQSQITTSN